MVGACMGADVGVTLTKEAEVIEIGGSYIPKSIH